MSAVKELGGQADPMRADQDAWMLDALGMDVKGDGRECASAKTVSDGDAEPTGGGAAGMNDSTVAMANTMPSMPKMNFKKVQMTASVPGIVLGKNKAVERFQKSVLDGAIKTSRHGKVVEIGVVEAEVKQHFTLTLRMVRNQVRDLGQIMDGIEQAAGEFGTQMTASAELVDLEKFQKEYRGLLAKASVHIDRAQQAADHSQPVTFEAELIQASRIVTSVDRGIADVNGLITKGADDLRKLAQAVETGCNAALTILSVCAPVGILGKVIEGSIREVEKQVSDRVDGKPFDVGKLSETFALNFLFASCGELVNASAEDAIASRVQPALLKRLGDPERVKQAIIALRISAVAILRTCLEKAIEKLLPHENEKLKKGEGSPKLEFAKAVIYEGLKGFVENLLQAAE